ncbi:MAG: hypothetical protein LBS94_01085 [Prevotellaceae bacterium]|nr:hypothetical protein [Prevotellaceae bacterium]
MAQIATKQGVAADPGYSRFIFTVNVVVTEKYLTPTAPPKQAYKMDVTFYIGDGLEGKIFSSTTTSVSGVGDNETKAYMAALKNISVLDPSYKKFADLGKQKIMDYYTSQCDVVIREAQTLSAAQKYDEAIYKLMSVPDACTECYKKAIEATDAAYQLKVDRECKMRLNEAATLWGAEQNVGGAKKAGAVLAKIDPSANCFSEALVLARKIAEEVKRLDERAYQDQQAELAFQKEMEQNKQAANTALEKERIQAYRDVQKAYAEHQPEVKYVRLW